MGNTAYQSMLAEARNNKAMSLLDPNGVRYMDQLWGMVESEPYIGGVVLRSDTSQFYELPVRAWWSHGIYDFEQPDASERSTLVFEINDATSRQIQSERAQRVMKRFFGDNANIVLEEPILSGDSDETRDGFHSYGPNTTYDVIEQDWATLKSAIELTAKDTGSYLGGQSVKLLSTAGSHIGRARVNETELELYIPNDAVTAIEDLWSKAFRREVLLED